MAILKQSTTYTRMFLLVESADHVTGLTGATATVTLSKAGGSFASAGGTVTEVSSGWYQIALTTTDTGTLGDLAFHITATSADPTDFVDQVCANILGDTIPANVTEINGVTTSSVTTINANLGTTQPVNFTGTGSSAYAKSDVIDVGGTTQTAADIGAIFATNGVETGYALKDAMRLIFSVLCGKVSGAPGAEVFRDVNDTKNRVSATSSSGNRSAMTLDAT